MGVSVLHRGARFSPDRVYRYQLERILDNKPGNTVVFAALNPSKAGEKEDDATVRRWTRFAYDWGYQRFLVVNLFAYISTNPTVLKGMFPEIAVGADNDDWIRRTVHGRDVVVCWGSHGGLHRRDLAVVKLLRNGPKSVRCFGRTKEGHPQHPLRLRADTKLVPYDVELVLASGLLES